jgi:UDP-N-acetylmuramate: L-alanyl-gamma-D-glutamyl-meso-diaminopimelate ligase
VTLNPSLNYFPDKVDHIHLMGICGTGMGSLAGMLKTSGYKITGSDQNVYPPMSDFLAQSGIPVTSGYTADNLDPGPDLVIVGNTISRPNPEAIGLADLGIPYVSFPQALAHYYLDSKTPLVVCGTHGKTTTASLLASLLHSAGQDAGFMIGGLVQAFGRNYNLGNSQYFVVEGDEYDTAFFDKGPKFLHYQPHIAVLTSIEFDHADIYADIDEIKNSFARLVAIMPDDGCLVACFDDPLVKEVVGKAQCRVIGYGLQQEFDWCLEDIQVKPDGTRFAVIKQGKPYATFSSPMPGRHNALNSLAVIAILDRLDIDKKVIFNGLQNFEGVKRRQEVRGVVDGITVIDDFAHHPTAVRETLGALKEAYEGRRLLAVFEPRTNSSRRRVFQKTYVASFDHADQVITKEPIALTNIPEEQRFSSRELTEDLVARGKDALYFGTTDEIIEYLVTNTQKGDVIAILSNGGFDNIHSRLLDKLSSRVV